MSQPYFSSSSRRDLGEILDYIARDKPGTALQYVDRLEEECWMLAENPGVGTARDDLQSNLRCWSFGNYVICFSPATDGVEIVRVVHGARDLGSVFQ